MSLPTAIGAILLAAILLALALTDDENDHVSDMEIEAAVSAQGAFK